MFGILAQYPEDTQEKLLVFQLPSHEGTTKDNLLAQLCGLLADVNNSSDQVSYTLAIQYLHYCYCIAILNCGIIIVEPMIVIQW